jgi:hypothetical protein
MAHIQAAVLGRIVTAGIGGPGRFGVFILPGRGFAALPLNFPRRFFLLFGQTIGYIRGRFAGAAVPVAAAMAHGLLGIGRIRIIITQRIEPPSYVLEKKVYHI